MLELGANRTGARERRSERNMNCVPLNCYLNRGLAVNGYHCYLFYPRPSAPIRVIRGHLILTADYADGRGYSSSSRTTMIYWRNLSHETVGQCLWRGRMFFLWSK